MRSAIALLAVLLAGCSKPAPAPTVDPMVGAWGDKDSVFQFFDNGTCVLLSKRFNISGSYKFESGKLALTGAKLQYHAPGFITLRSPTFDLQAELTDRLTISDPSSTLLDKAKHFELVRLGDEDTKETIGRISGAHRRAIRQLKQPISRGDPSM